MPFNGSGSFTPPGSSFPATSGAVISSSKFNNLINDISSALSTCVTKDGQTTITADQPMGGYKHTGVANAASRDNYAALGQVQDGGATWAGTAGGTANAITLTLTPAISAYAAGQEFTYKSGSSANSGGMTVNVSSLGTKAILKNGAALASGDHPANSWFRIVYDGAAFQLEQILQPSAFMTTVLADTTAAAARTTLGAVGLTGTETIAGNKTFSGLTQITGALTTTDIGTGYIGEAFEDNVESGAALALTTATPKTITSRTLQPGHWEVGGIVNINLGATTQISSFFGGASLTNNAFDGYSFAHRCAAFTPGTSPMGYSIPPRIIKIDAPTPVYLVASAGFTTSTCSAWGYLRTRRVA